MGEEEAPYDPNQRDDWPLRGRLRKSYLPYAVRVRHETLDEISDYDDCTVGYNWQREDESARYYVTVETRRGTQRASMGDWIFEDPEGRHYPVSHDEVRRLYRPASGEHTSGEGA